MKPSLALLVIALVSCGTPSATPGTVEGKPSPGPEPREAPNPSCTSIEIECELPGGAIGWCGHKAGKLTGRCKAVCPPGYSYTSVSTSCYRRCDAACKTCRENDFAHYKDCADPGPSGDVLPNDPDR